ncbi:toxin-antitoxin system HicB family antitoxin [Mycobacterium kansasii]|uniref:toxin-antitoxin system HicB family antitoxin n=1 Tax=Mycobacterium kansasii TaxID=1768 RepID=UPI001CE38CEE|nr:toxin-antitoxin system HicB family antitoxin [Mycobacterium kansasii]UCA17796.1 type II toxin-antitoxin system HicB family antitoxin [Mycobacterium kansasii]UGT82655.1 type II toxin-antitoxin system HicB family antitoxin [Mycobacterium kansasii]UGT86933.1 type II toxin-antitoxin system HicB family antitoxin [Mycobacterium kansasii]
MGPRIRRTHRHPHRNAIPDGAGDARQEAIAAIEDAVDQRTSSGTPVVRTSPALRARLAIEAAEQRVSMNQWISSEAGRSSIRRHLRTFPLRLAVLFATNGPS